MGRKGTRKETAGRKNPEGLVSVYRRDKRNEAEGKIKGNRPFLQFTQQTFK